MTSGLRTGSFAHVVLAVMLAVTIVAAGVFIAPQKLFASSLLYGYAWSDTIGWISMSGVGYGISIDASGNLSGYAWSENIGWISAEAADVAGCPGGTCGAKVTGGTFTGWLKAIGANGNGWDGWISLNCSNTGTCATSNYSVTSSAGTYAGYAWGSDVVGWISFAQVLPAPPTCAITPSPATIVRGATASLSWTSTDATSGSITILGNVSANGSGSVQPNATTTYNGTFGGPGGYGNCSAQVGVQCAPIYSCSGQTVQFTNAACATNNVVTCVSPASCVPGQSACVNPPPGFTGQSATTTGHLQTAPQVVRVGLSVKVFWNVTNVTSCSVTSTGGDSWSGLSSGVAGRTSLPIQSSTIFTLACNALSGVIPSSFSEAVTVVPSPIYQEQ